MHQKPSYEIVPQNTTLLIVDPQVAFGEVVPVPDVDSAIKNMVRCVDVWGMQTHGHLFYTQHSYMREEEVGRIRDFIPGIFSVLRLGSPHAKPHPVAKAARDMYAEKHPYKFLGLMKRHFNAFHGTSLDDQLRVRRVDTLVICGLTTPICVEATVRGAHERDYKIILIEDACASQPMGELHGITEQENARRCHRMAIERMRYVFAEVITTDQFVKRISNR